MHASTVPMSLIFVRVAAFLGLSFVGGVAFLRQTWIIAPQQFSLNSFYMRAWHAGVRSTANPQHARAHALDRLEALRQTKRAGSESHKAALQEPETLLSFTDQNWHNTDPDSEEVQQLFHKGIASNDSAAVANDISQSDRARVFIKTEGEIAARCRSTLGDWCQHAMRQYSIAKRALSPSGNLTCHAGCNGVGNCNAFTGECDCPAGEAASPLND